MTLADMQWSFLSELNKTSHERSVAGGGFLREMLACGVLAAKGKHAAHSLGIKSHGA
jgi:hypothetical protein